MYEGSFKRIIGNTKHPKNNNIPMNLMIIQVDKSNSFIIVKAILEAISAIKNHSGRFPLNAPYSINDLIC